MTTTTFLAAASLAAAAVPALLAAVNLRRFRPPAPAAVGAPRPRVSVLIPARNEEAVIGDAVRSVLASRGVELELVVLDDGSTDRTAEIVAGIARADGRVRVEPAPPLPPGWCGKQHACFELAARAGHPLLVFVDADVRLAPDALARAAAFMDETGVELASGFPRQETETWLEKLLIPLIHWVLLGFLPMGRMRRTTSPAYAAGCGQLMVVKRSAYDATGGHRAIAASLHDGIQLPRTFRRHGYRTDVFDAVPLASCRMYRNAREVWQGLAKNATEGLAAPPTLLPVTLVWTLGQLLPPGLVVAGAAGLLPPAATGMAAAALALSYLPRLAMTRRFRQPWLGAALHPLGVLLLLAIQWYALVRSWTGRRPTWKGRSVVPGRAA